MIFPSYKVRILSKNEENGKVDGFLCLKPMDVTVYALPRLLSRGIIESQNTRLQPLIPPSLWLKPIEYFDPFIPRANSPWRIVAKQKKTMRWISYIIFFCK